MGPPHPSGSLQGHLPPPELPATVPGNQWCLYHHWRIDRVCPGRLLVLRTAPRSSLLGWGSAAPGIASHFGQQGLPAFTFSGAPGSREARASSPGPT